MRDDSSADSFFIITAIDPRGNELRDLRRRQLRWNQQRVEELIDHVETRTEEAAFEQGYTAMQVPRKLVSIVRQLIALMDQKSDVAT